MGSVYLTIAGGKETITHLLLCVPVTTNMRYIGYLIEIKWR